MLVLVVVRTVDATVHAVIRQVKRREHHDPVAVEFLFYFLRQREDPLVDLRQLAFEQQQGFAVVDPLAEFRLSERGVDLFPVPAVLFREPDGGEDLIVVDEFPGSG
ncbi:hypothetical protein SDC9_206212 [bioreactor metagenome]|uniref:Uncharacterized protein n=1 Tax=bioreactor metagenome TaxID=1076179 RepID=A0A645J540_9ZZZZ